MTRTDTFSSDHLDFPGAETLMAAGRVAPPKAETVAAAQAVVRAAIERDAEVAALTPATALTPAAGTPSAARPRRRAGFAGLFFRPRVVATALAAAVAAGVIAYPALTTTDSAPSQPPQPPRAVSAKAFLNDMAQVAAATPAAKAPYWKTSLTVTVPADGEKERTHTRYLDRKGKSTEVNPDGSTQVAVRARAYAVGDRTLGWNQLDKLPTDPKALAALLPSPNSADGKAKSTFDNATALLGESPARPDLRAALYRVLAGLPGVEVAGPAKDATGRTGTALEWTTDSGTLRLIVNPKTGDLLEETETAPRTGALQARYTYLSNAPADSIG
ncbi:CU044_5270 family protein [Streptomyces sp. NPDC059679]|uniref:CU044_5270 family protein n=1 Tax=Streptomyces sp. NPDC059679 TaxID=3346903 RepID=UPI0036C45FC0